MHVLHINTEQDIVKLNKYMDDGLKAFILVFMEGCGPCNATRPEWAKMVSAVKEKYKHNKFVVADVNKDVMTNLKYIGNVNGFPTIKYIEDKGNIIESYEDSSVEPKNRSVDSFIQWIEQHINNTVVTHDHSNAQQVYNRLKGGKRSRSKSRRNRRSKSKKSRRSRSKKSRSRRRY